MDNQQEQFRKTMAMIAALYDKEIVGPKLQAYWLILGKYPAEDVQAAAMKHHSGAWDNRHT
tara:strand:+ start:418 stop:600 length:183 start_codon:yes stop_codon:yes gene_type:complete